MKPELRTCKYFSKLSANAVIFYRVYAELFLSGFRQSLSSFCKVWDKFKQNLIKVFGDEVRVQGFFFISADKFKISEFVFAAPFEAAINLS